MRIIVTGGGTGGHVFPALEIAKELHRQNDKIQVIFVGNKDSLEEKMARSANLKFYGLSAKRIVGQSLLKKFTAVIFLMWAVIVSFGFLLRTRPKAVIGVGGFVSAPMIIASLFLGIKRYICEQNVVPGFANHKLGIVANRVFISFEESRRFFSANKTILSGNPVRADFFALPMKEPQKKLHILITGGSLGARFLNSEVPQVLLRVIKQCPNISITHQTGKVLKDEVAHIYREAGVNAEVVSFIDHMPKAFLEHDLLISRAGATVCAEIMAAGMPSILVPYPFANAHQKYNALALHQLGAAIMIEEDRSFNDRLADTIKSIYSDPNTLHQMGHKAKSMGTKKAASVIINHVLNDVLYKE